MEKFRSCSFRSLKKLVYRFQKILAFLVQEHGSRWLLSDNKQTYIIRKDYELLNVYASQIIVPTQEVTEIKGGKKKNCNQDIFSWICPSKNGFE